MTNRRGMGVKTGVRTPRVEYPPELVACVLGMLRRGDRQRDVMVYHGISPHAVAIMSKRHRAEWKELRAAPRETLPPPGPYKVVSQDVFSKMRDAAAIPLAQLDLLHSKIDKLTEALNERSAEPIRTVHAGGSCGAVPTPGVDQAESACEASRGVGSAVRMLPGVWRGDASDARGCCGLGAQLELPGL